MDIPTYFYWSQFDSYKKTEVFLPKKIVPICSIVERTGIIDIRIVKKFSAKHWCFLNVMLFGTFFGALFIPKQ